MTYLARILILPIFFFSCIGSALFADSSIGVEQEKLYIDNKDIAIDDQDIFVHLADDWMKTDAIRSDEHGLYVFGEDLTEYGSRVSPSPQQWKCPYCYYWWDMGEPCTNRKCPTNQWNKDEKEES